MRNKNNGSYGLLLLMLLLIGASMYVYFSSMFERNSPIATIENNGYWNLQAPLKIKIDDESNIKSYKITLKTATEENTLQYEQLQNPQSSINLEVEPPRNSYAIKEEKIQIIIEANDSSKWNFLNGNASKTVFNLIVDKKRPKLNVLSNSYKISKGGSALVIFEVEDENINDIYIESSNEKKFIPQPFYKNGYYISLLAWPVTDESFKATVIATDKAGNMSKAYIPLYLQDKKYKVSKIKLSDDFLKGKIADLAQEFAETQGIEGSLEQFKIINEDVRAKNEALIHEITSKVKNDTITKLSINKMYPLKNAQVVATFGDHRIYSYDGENISESYHLGLDLASNAMASIKPQNSGEVVFSEYNGLYGNMPLIHHGLGLYTLYGHCSSVKVAAGESVSQNMDIANTGKSGYAMGDHLHFGVLVQGIEVRPQEWMDEQWIKLNINDVIKNAKDNIDRN